MNFQPPDPPDHGHCLTCNTFIHESEKRGDCCIECEPEPMNNDPRNIAMPPITVMLAPPYGEVVEEDLRAILEDITKTVRNPHMMITKGQLKGVAAQLLARNYILEKRVLEQSLFNNDALAKHGLLLPRLTYRISFVEGEGHVVYAYDLDGSGWKVGPWHFKRSDAEVWAAKHALKLDD